MLWIQIIGVLFALDMIFITYFYHRRRVFYLHDTIIWMSIWVGLLFSVIFPSTLEIVIEPLKIIRVMDFLTMGAFFLTFSLLFVVFIRTRQGEKKIEKIVRELTFKDAERKK